MTSHRLAACAAVAVLAAGCGGAGSTAAAASSSTTVASAAATPAAADQAVRETPAAGAAAPGEVTAITPEGFGPVRIGMTEAEALRALGAGWSADQGAGDAAACHYIGRGQDGAEFEAYMVEAGRVTNATVQNDAPTAGRVSIVTDRGVGLGSTEAQVRAAYPGIEVEPHRYNERPASYFTFWVRGAPSTPGGQPAADARGIQFVTNAERVVTSIQAGGPSILYVEGCA